MAEYLGGPAGRVAEALFRLGADLRGAFYEKGLLRVHRLPVPVVSVGNLLVGGTGKTPVAMALAGRLSAAGRKVVLLSRGYGRRDPGKMLVLPPGEGEREAAILGDEPALIRERLPHLAMVLCKNRVAGGEEAVRRFHPDLILLDDGMQHRRIARDVELVLLPGIRPFGNGALLPRGPLRERPQAIARADRLLIHTTGGEEEGVEETLDEMGATPKRTRFRYEAAAWIDPSGAAAGADSLRGKRVLAVSAIANPASFERCLVSLGCELAGSIRFRDHHRFTAEECGTITREGVRLSAIPVTTEKDRVRLAPGTIVAARIHTLRVEVAFADGGEWIDRLPSAGERT